ncbi:MAG: RluA family pseudouridine synthase [Burkholderiales bacterium]|nr:RluA family pseudouridine synthase [Burkholderiales bacterium]
MSGASKNSVTWKEIDENAAEQRIDNFLVKTLKGVPRSHIYRLLRNGEVRVNSGRVAPTYRLQSGDRLRIPPVRVAQSKQSTTTAGARFKAAVIFEDDYLLVLAKPAGIAVHGGSGISRGVIEQIRLLRPELKFIELAHRLDRETSGLLLLAKKRAALLGLHAALREGNVEKRYLALTSGVWRNARQNVRLPLKRYLTARNERRVAVGEDGQTTHTVFTLERSWHDFSLLNAELKTGRTHQIRVHLSHLGFPIAGDDKYGNFALNRQLAKRGLKRMFLHAASLVVEHPVTGALLDLNAPLPEELASFLQTLDDRRQSPANLREIEKI